MWKNVKCVSQYQIYYFWIWRIWHYLNQKYFKNVKCGKFDKFYTIFKRTVCYISVANLVTWLGFEVGEISLLQNNLPFWNLLSFFSCTKALMCSSDSLDYFKKWFDVSNLSLYGTLGQCLTSLRVICILIFLSNVKIKSLLSL